MAKNSGPAINPPDDRSNPPKPPPDAPGADTFVQQGDVNLTKRKHHVLTAESLTGSSSLTVGADVLKQTVQTDLDAQRKAAEIALAEAQKIDKLLISSPTEDHVLLKDAKDAFLRVAQILAANATTTSTAVLDIVSSAQPGELK